MKDLLRINFSLPFLALVLLCVHAAYGRPPETAGYEYRSYDHQGQLGFKLSAGGNRILTPTTVGEISYGVGREFELLIRGGWSPELAKDITHADGELLHKTGFGEENQKWAVFGFRLLGGAGRKFKGYLHLGVGVGYYFVFSPDADATTFNPETDSRSGYKIAALAGGGAQYDFNRHFGCFVEGDVGLTGLRLLLPIVAGVQVRF